MKNKILILVFAAALSANFALAENFEITADDISRATKSCDKGDMKLCGALAQIYNYGWGVPQDLLKAAPLYVKACKGGDVESCVNLGILYQSGEGMPRDETKAAELFDKACDDGHAIGCSNAGSAYIKGRGVRKDAIKGVGYYVRGCDMDITDSWLACLNLARLYEGADNAKAAQYYKKACELGSKDRFMSSVTEHERAWQSSCESYERLK